MEKSAAGYRALNQIYCSKEGDLLPISMEKVRALMELRGFNKHKLRLMGVNGSVLDKVLGGPLDKSKRVDTETISKLCKILDCQPGDIMEYEPDEP